MEIKYCKNCANFSPTLGKAGLKYDEDFSWGNCRVIHKLEMQNNRLTIIQQKSNEIIVEKSVPANQVIRVDQNKICPAYSNLSDIFNADYYNPEVSDIDILKDLNSKEK